MQRIGSRISNGLPSFSDDSMKRIAQALEAPAEEKLEEELEEEIEEAEEELEEEAPIKLASLNSIPRGFFSIGTGFYRKAHGIWKLEKASNGYELVRVAMEPLFEDDAEEEDEKVSPEACPKKMASLEEPKDELSLDESLEPSDEKTSDMVPEKGDEVEFESEGCVSTGCIACVRKNGFVDIKIKDRLLKNIPSEFLRVTKTAQELENPNKEQAENDEHNMVEPRPKLPKKEAVDETAKAYWAEYFKNYGEALCATPPRKTHKASKERIYTWNE